MISLSAVVLLSGVVALPFIPIWVLVAFTKPITFYFYTLFAKQWATAIASKVDAKAKSATGVLSVRLLMLSILLRLAGIIGPMVVSFQPALLPFKARQLLLL